MDPKPKQKKEDSGWRQAGLALTVPWLMLSGPITGFLLALGIIWFFKLSEPWDGRIKIIMVLVGTIAGVRESIRLLKRINTEGR